MKKKYSIFVILFSIIFISCENFLDGANLKNILDNEIELASAPEFFIEFKLPGNNIGTISPNGNQKYKKGQTIDIEITLKENVTLSSLNVYSKTGSSHILNNSAISFTKVSQNSQFGQNVYRYKATILSDSNELLVVPNLVNPLDTTPPQVLDNEQFPFILKRTKDLDFKETGNASKYTDSFFINFTAIEQENQISELCKLNFYDSDNFENCYGSQNVTAEITDQGNGYYNISINSDLKDAYSIQDDTEFYLEIELSDGFSSGKKQITSKQFTKYTKSKSRLAVYNSVNITKNNCITSYIESYNPTANLTLEILEIDEFFPDNYDIQWGYTQNFDELSNIPLEKITSYSKNQKITLSSIEINGSTKNTYIKIVSSALFNNKEENIFVIPAAPDTLLTKVYPGTGMGIWMDVIVKKASIPESDTDASAYYYIHDGDKHPTDPDIFYYNKYWTDYGAYIYNIKDNTTEIEPCYYLQSSYDYKVDGKSYSIYGPITEKKLAVENIDSEITYLPHMDEKDFSIEAGPLNSGYHLIKLDYSEELLNQFDSFLVEIWRDNVYVNVQAVETLGKDYILAKIPTQYFYGSNATKTNRIDEKFKITGIKNGAAYSTEYTISSTNTHIMDNMSPSVNITYSIDPHQSYIDIPKPDDIGSGIKIKTLGMINKFYDVTYKITGITVGYEEEKTLSIPLDKSPAIPIAHLRNGQYNISVTVYDEAGNSTTKNISYEKNRSEVPLRSLEFIKGTGSNSVQISRVLKMGKDFKKLIDEKPYVYGINSTTKGWTLLGNSNSDVWQPEKVNSVVTYDYNLPSDSLFLKGFYGSYYPIMAHYPLDQTPPQLKEYMILSDSIAVYTDKSVFIHTLCSEYDWGKNYKDWEFHSEMNVVNDEKYPFANLGNKEFNMVFKSGDHLTSPYFYSIPWSDIEKFPYAAVIIYYADNTAKLVRLK